MIPFNNVVVCWAEGLIKMRGIWFGLVLPIEKNWSDDTSRVTHLTQTLSELRLSLKGRVEIAGVFIASVITYRLTVVSCPRS